jgi:2-dehydro-3-deoxyglucarate aldolase
MNKIFTESTLKKKLQNKNVSIGSWITLAHPAIAEIMAKASYEWLVVDLEHSVITIREAEELIRVIELSGVTPLVRLTSNNPDQIKRVMDAGSHGIIIPMVNTADQAEQAVNAVRYPVRGSRGFGLARAQAYGNKFQEYLEWLSRDSIIIVQIEHIDAIDNLESIFSVDGIDGYIIGPYDLSGSMGIPGQLDHQDLQKIMIKINEIGKKMNMAGGIHVVEPDISKLESAIDMGHTFIAYSVDIRMLDHSCRNGMERILEKI